jgi:hypothetical protein
MLFIGAGDFDANHLIEAQTHFTLWAMLDAPLLIGYDLRTAPQSLLDIWGNTDLIAVNQDPLGNQAVPAYRSSNLDILVKTLANGDKAVALFNRSDRPITATLTSDHLKFDPRAPVILRDLWTKQTRPAFVGATSVALAPRQTLVFSAHGTHPAGGVYLSEIPARIHVASDGLSFPELDPEISRAASEPTRGPGPAPEYGGWGGAQADASPYSTPLAVGTHAFAGGIGVLANSRLEVRADATFTRFTATVGIDNATRNRNAAVRFQVYGDGKLLSETGPLAFGDPPAAIAADVRGVAVVELVVRSMQARDAAPATVWGDAKLQ